MVKRRPKIEVGKIFETSNGRLYAVCPKCHSLVRVDKPIFGSVHFCVGGDDGDEDDC